MAVLGAIREAMGLDTPPAPAFRLPDGLSPEGFITLADAAKPAGYASQVELALQHYFGLAQADTVAALRRAFPKTVERMTPVQLRYVSFVIDRQAAVFAGKPAFELLGADGAAIDQAGGARWAEVVRGAELQRRLQQVNRRTLLCRTAFARVTWDAASESVRVAVFTPDKVHVLYAPDSCDLNEAAGVLLDIEPAWEQGRPVRRWELWSAGDEPRNFIIDEEGETYALGDGTNPYRDDAGRPLVPIVRFTEDDDDAGCWPMPSQSLLSTARALNVKATALNHVQGVQSFGQWLSEVNPGEESPEPWSGEPVRELDVRHIDRILGRRSTVPGMTVTFGPDTLLQVPRGRTIRNEAPQLSLSDQASANDHFLRQNLIFESCPPGELLSESRAASGFQLVVERLGLTELRTDQLARYRHPTERVIDLVRRVWDAHQPTDATRFGPCRPRFTPGHVDTPIDPATENATDAFLLAHRLTTRAHVLARREGIPLEEARSRVAEIDAGAP